MARHKRRPRPSPRPEAAASPAPPPLAVAPAPAPVVAVAPPATRPPAAAGPPWDLLGAHAYSFKNQASVRASQVCGCFYCGSTYPPKDVISFAAVDKTAICPKCGIDSVLGDATPFPVTNLEFLKAMRAHFFKSAAAARAAAAAPAAPPEDPVVADLKARLTRSDSPRVRRKK